MGAFVYPFLTLFMSNKLGYDELTISRYLLVTSIVFLPAAILGGKLGDRFSRKTVYVLLMGTGLTCFLMAGFLIEKPYVVAFVIVGFFFTSASSPVITAMMMDRTNESNRQVSFSLIYLGFNLGYAIGPLIAGFLFANYLPWIFWGNGLIGLIAILIILVKIEDKSYYMSRLRDDYEDAAYNRHIESQKANSSKTDDIEKNIGTEAEASQSIRGSIILKSKRENVDGNNSRGLREVRPGDNLFTLVMRDKLLVVVAAMSAIYSFGYSNIGYMLPLDMERVFGIDLGSKYFGGVSSLNGICVFLFTPLLVYIFKNMPPIFNIGLAGLLYGIGFGGFSFSTNILYIYLMVIIWSAGEVMSATNTGVFIASHAPESYRARYQSIYDIIQGIGRAAGPFTMGYFLLKYDISQGWLLIGGMCITAFLLLCILHKRGYR